MAMAGRNSVAIAVDARFGLGFQTISTTTDSASDSLSSGTTTSRIMLLPGSNTLMAWTGLYGDGISFTEEMNVLLARKMRRSRTMIGFDTASSIATTKNMSPRSIAMFMSHLLYSRRSAPYYVEPVIVGLENVRIPLEPETTSSEATLVNGKKDKLEMIDSVQHLQAIASLQYNQQMITPTNSQVVSKANKCTRYKTIQRPYLCTTDMLGARSTSSTFVCSGVASRSLHGTAEALWRPNLEAEDLVQVCGKAFVSALERDCLSGYGAVIYLIQSHDDNEDGDDTMADNNISIKEYVLACRND